MKAPSLNSCLVGTSFSLRGSIIVSTFFERENNLHFLRLIRRYLVGPGTADILAYCLMPNHYHLLIHLRQPDLSDAMRRLAMAYAKAINKRHERSGPLFQGPFKSILVDQDAYLLHLSRYIHFNPVKAGFVNDLNDWEFSSYHEYVERREGTLPSTGLVQSQLDGQTYQSFLDAEVLLEAC